MRRIEPHFPLSFGVPSVDDRWVIFVIRNGLRWRHMARTRPSITGLSAFSQAGLPKVESLTNP
jgi:hypothetical protein